MEPPIGIRGYELDYQQINYLPNPPLCVNLVHFSLFCIFNTIDFDSSTVAIAESIIFMAFPHTLYFFALDFVVGKCEFT